MSNKNEQVMRKNRLLFIILLSAIDKLNILLSNLSKLIFRSEKFQ